MTVSSIRNKLLAAGIMLGLWFILSKIYPPLVVPSIKDVVCKILEIFSHKDLMAELSKTLLRLFMGLIFGISAGCLTGFLAGTFKTFRELSKPILGFLQVLPPVAILVLAIIWFGFNGKPAILIVALAVFPTISINVQDAMLNVDEKLLKMGIAFRFDKKRMFFYITWPSIKVQFYSGLKIALGIATKTVIMGEVLTTSTGVGGQITTARLNVEPETIIAWTLIAVAIFYLMDAGISLLFVRRRRGKIAFH